MITIDLDLLKINGSEDILDAGCGNGRHIWQATKANTGASVAFDLDVPSLQRAGFMLHNMDEKKECAGEAILQCLIEKDVKHIVSANFGKRVQQEMVNHDIKMTLLTDCSKTVGEIIRIIKRKHTK